MSDEKLSREEMINRLDWIKEKFHESGAKVLIFVIPGCEQDHAPIYKTNLPNQQERITILEQILDFECDYEEKEIEQ